MYAVLANKLFGISKLWPPGDGGSRARERLGGVSFGTPVCSRRWAESSPPPAALGGGRAPRTRRRRQLVRDS
jgi:hypothetical protein